MTKNCGFVGLFFGAVLRLPITLSGFVSVATKNKTNINLNTKKLQIMTEQNLNTEPSNSTKPVLKAVFENIFLIPILPYHLVLFIWVNYVAFRDVAMTGDVKKNKTFDNYCRKVDDKLMPLKYAISTLFWLYVIF